MSPRSSSTSRIVSSRRAVVIAGSKEISARPSDSGISIDAGAILERARRIDDDDGAAAEGGELRGRVRFAGQLRLRETHDDAAQITIDLRQRVDDLLGEGERHGPGRAEELAGPAAAGRDLANLRCHFY